MPAEEPGGFLRLNLRGTPGFLYVIQANMSLVGGDWPPVFTSSAPITLTDHERAKPAATLLLRALVPLNPRANRERVLDAAKKTPNTSHLTSGADSVW